MEVDPVEGKGQPHCHLHYEAQALKDDLGARILQGKSSLAIDAPTSTIPEADRVCGADHGGRLAGTGFSLRPSMAATPLRLRPIGCTQHPTH